MLTVQWQSSGNGDGAPVTYVVTASPGSTEVNTTVTSASLSGVPYNVINTSRKHLSCFDWEHVVVI